MMRDNPLGLDGFEFVEFTGPDPEALGDLFAAMGFTHVGDHRSKNVRRYAQGDINFLLNMEPSGQVAGFREAHGASVNAMAFRVGDAAKALRLAVDGVMGSLTSDPIKTQVAAVSCGIYEGTPVLDLDYIEDSNAHADANFVLIGDGNIAEVQATAEGATYDEEALLRLLRLARIGCSEIFAAQKAATGR